MSANVHLTPKQEQFIACLISGMTIVAAAGETGIAEKTAHRWLKRAEVQSAYQAARESLFDEALQGLRLKVQKAIDTLDRNMSDEAAPANVQVRAAQIVLEQAISIHKMSELEAKVLELERIVKDRTA